MRSCNVADCIQTLIVVSQHQKTTLDPAGSNKILLLGLGIAHQSPKCSWEALARPRLVCDPVLAGNGNRDLAMRMLRKTESLEGAHGKHGNPFSDDGSAEGRHDKSPLLIASADSSYALDMPRR